MRKRVFVFEIRNCQTLSRISVFVMICLLERPSTGCSLGVGGEGSVLSFQLQFPLKLWEEWTGTHRTAIFLNSPSVCCWQRREGQARVLLCLAGFSCLKEKVCLWRGRTWLKKHLYIKQLLSESPHTEIKRTWRNMSIQGSLCQLGAFFRK